MLDKRLSQSEFVADAYSIADMAIFPWCARADWQGIDLAAEFPNVNRWSDAIGNRPSVQKGMSVPG